MDGEFSYAPVIARLSRQIDCCMNRTLEKYGLTQSQLRVLLYIRKHESAEGARIFQKDIEKAFMLSNPAVSGILGRLEAKGLIERKVSFSDCRHKELYTTEQARALEESLTAFRDEYEELLLDGIAQEDREILKKSLVTMLHNCGKYQDICGNEGNQTHDG